MKNLLWTGVILAVVLVCAFSWVRSNSQVQAAVGINKQINFQGKLVNPNGTNVTDGTYTIVFSIYTVSSGGTAVWTETQTPSVTQGIFQVSLGSVTALPGSIDFNTDNIYLGMKVGADAEMTPRIRFSAVPQAFNSEKLGGIDKSGFAQLAPNSVQGVNSADTALRINQTGAGNLLQLQGNGADVMTLSKTGALSVSGTGTFAGASLTVGAAAQAGSLILNDGSGQTATISVGNIAASTTLTLPAALGASDTFCFVTLNNCLGSATLQQAYGNDTDGSDTIISLTTADDSLVFRNPAASGTDSTFLATFEQLNTGAKDLIVLTQAGTGYSLRINDDGTSTDSTPFIIDQDGNVGIGRTDASYKLDIQGADAFSSGIRQTRISADVNSSTLYGFKARGSVGAPADVLSGDSLQRVSGYGYQDGDYRVAGWLEFEADTVTTANEVGGRFQIVLRNASTSSNAIRFYIDENGDIAAGSSTSPTARLHVLSSDNRDLFKVTDSTATAKNVLVIEDEGAVTFGNRMNSTAGFQIQDAGGTNVFKVDTTNERVGIGNFAAGTAPSAKLHVTTGIVEALRINQTGAHDIANFQDSGVSVLSIADGGNATFGNDVFINGNTALGSASTDTITLTGQVNSHILPSADDTYDLGSTNNRWRDLYLGPASLHVGVNGNEGSIGFNTIDSKLTINGNSGVNIQSSSNTATALNIMNATGNSLFAVDAVNGGIRASGNLSSDTGIAWTSRSAPTASQWRSIAYGNGVYVAVSSDNEAMISSDGINWSVNTAAANNFWNSVTYGNGLFVAVASTGTGNRVMTSPDGITWTARTSAADNSWNDVTYGNGLFVAVASTGTGNRVMTSPDGITWTARTSAADNSWMGVTYGNSLFVAVAASGTGNRVMTSPDGITWTIRTSAADNSWYDVAYGNGLFVAVAVSGTGNRVMTSPDGITWTIRTSAADNFWYDVTYGNGLFVAVAGSGTGNRVMTSPDGITWTIRTSAADLGWYGVVYGDNKFVAVAISGGNNRVMTSGRVNGLSLVASGGAQIENGLAVDGNVSIGMGTTNPGLFKLQVAGDIGPSVNNAFDLGSNTNRWQELYLGPSSLHIGASGNEVNMAYDTANNRLAMNTNSGGVNLQSTTNSSTALQVSNVLGRSMLTVDTFDGGIDIRGGGDIAGAEWTSRNSSADSSWRSVTYGNGVFVALAWSSPYVMTSTDGINWTSRTATARTWQEVDYLNGLFVAVGTNGVMTSTDGITWTDRTVPTGSWRSASYGNGTYTIVGSYENVLTSTDGVTWTSRTAHNGYAWNDVVYANSLFVAVASNGTDSNQIMTSTDGITWTLRAAPSSAWWNAVTYGNGKFVAVRESNTGRSMYSTDGINWTLGDLDASEPWIDITYGNGLFVAIGRVNGDYVATSEDGENWTYRNAAQSYDWQGVTYGNGIFVAVSSSGTGNRVMTSTGINTYNNALRVTGSSNFTGDLIQIGNGVNALGDQESMVPNAGFEVNEDSDSTVADGWNTFQNVGTPSFSVTSTSPAQGSYSQTITATTAQDGQVYSNCFPISGGRAYSFYVRAKSSVAVTSNVNMLFATYTTKANCVANTSATALSAQSNASTGTAYAELGGTVTAGATATWARVNIASVTPSANTTTTIDSVRVTPSVIAAGIDLAENFPALKSDDLLPGELVSFGGPAPEGGAYAVRSSGVYDKNLFGVISTQPGLTLDDGKAYEKVAVALTGRVPVKVTGENGSIAVGDPITASSVPGVGMKATKAGRIIGTAVTAFDGTGDGTIIVLINPEFWAPPMSQTLQAGGAAFGSLEITGTANIATLNVSGSATIKTLLVLSDATIEGVLTVQNLVVKQNIIVEGHFYSAGIKPLVEKGLNLGSDSPVLAARAEIDGTDTAGTLTMVAGENSASGVLARVTFNKAYEKTPRIVLSAVNEDGLSLPVFARKVDGGFEIVTTGVPQVGKSYTYDYVIIGAETAVAP